MKNKYKVLIISCWVLLVIAMILKLLGSDWFIATSDNKRFIKLCDYIDDHYVLQSIIYAIIGFISCNIYYMAVLQEKRITKKSLKWIIPVLIYSIAKAFLGIYMSVVFVLLDFFMTIGLPIIIDKKSWKLAIIGTILLWVFQLISLIAKMNNYKMFDNNTLIDIILNIDYYIMLVLFYLYVISRKKNKESEV